MQEVWPDYDSFMTVSLHAQNSDATCHNTPPVHLFRRYALDACQTIVVRRHMVEGSKTLT